MTNLLAFDIEGFAKRLKELRDEGTSVLNSIRDNPQLKSFFSQLQGILGKPVIKLTDAELSDLINSRHKGNQAKSKPFPKSESLPDPVDTGEGNPLFRYSPDVHTKEQIEAAIVAKPRQITKGAEIYGDGKTWEESKQFTVYIPGGLGTSPRARNWGEPLKIMP